jgi:hypothetical protein
LNSAIFSLTWAAPSLLQNRASCGMSEKDIGASLWTHKTIRS